MLQPTHRPSCRRPDGAAADAISRSVIKKCLNVTETHNKKTNARGGSLGQKGVEGGQVAFRRPQPTYFLVASFPREGVSCSFPSLFLATRGETKKKKTQMAGHFKCADLPLINGRKRSLD